MESLDNGVNNSVNQGPKRTGALLADARVAAGLELTDIARETRIPLRHLKAIEADRHDELPALPYAIGFVKSYARSVGLDIEATAAQFRSETTKVAHVPTPLTLEPLDERRMPARVLVFASVAVVVAIIAGLSAWGSGMFDAPPPPEATAPDTSVAAAPVEAEPAPLAGHGVAVAGADGAATLPPAMPAALPAGAATGPVVLTAREPVWVKIFDRATNTTVRIGVLQAGESYTVPSDPPGLMLWTGKAGAIDVAVGGRRIPPLGGPVETVRNLSLAPADLIARGNPAAPGAAPAAASGAAGATTAAVNGAQQAAPVGPRPIAQMPRPRPAPAGTLPDAAMSPAAATPGV